jgi:hypothetical protein
LGFTLTALVILTAGISYAAGGTGIASQTVEAPKSVSAGDESVVFAGIKYYLRTHQKDRYTFTPAGQENLERWTDMITLAYDPKVTEGKQLAEQAVAWWQFNRDARARFWHINYVPRLDQMPARANALYLTATILARPDHDYDEFAYTTIRLVGGIAATARYSHREYRTGPSSDERSGTWMKENQSLGEDWFVWDGVDEYARKLKSVGIGEPG